MMLLLLMGVIMMHRTEYSGIPHLLVVVMVMMMGKLWLVLMMLLLLLLGVRRVVVASAPARMQLHVQFLLLAGHVVVLGLFAATQSVPLKHKRPLSLQYIINVELTSTLQFTHVSCVHWLSVTD